MNIGSLDELGTLAERGQLPKLLCTNWEKAYGDDPRVVLHYARLNKELVKDAFLILAASLAAVIVLLAIAVFSNGILRAGALLACILPIFPCIAPGKRLKLYYERRAEAWRVLRPFAEKLGSFMTWADVTPEVLATRHDHELRWMAQGAVIKAAAAVIVFQKESKGAPRELVRAGRESRRNEVNMRYDILCDDFDLIPDRGRGRFYDRASVMIRLDKAA